MIYFTTLIAIADLFLVAYVGFAQSMASHPQAGLHFRDAREHLHLTDIFHDQPILHRVPVVI